MLPGFTRAFAALTVDVDFGDDATYGTIETAVEGEVATQLAKYTDMPDLTRGFANANTYASGAATMRGYQGYDLFSLAVGSMVTVQAPNAEPKFYEDLQDELDSGDLYAGVGANPVVVQVGLNLGFIVPDLYVSFRFGKLSVGIDRDDYKVDYDSKLFGVLLNYQIFSGKSILSRALLWRGISFESGFIYSKNRVTYFEDLDKITVTSGTTIAEVDPSVDFKLDIKSYIVPVELYTAMRLLYFLNFGVGIGFDYVTSSSTELSVRSAGSAVVTQLSGVPTNVPGSVTVDAGTKGKADKYRPKGMVNLGLGVGPVIIDVPLTFYLDNGYAAGITAGVVW